MLHFYQTIFHSCVLYSFVYIVRNVFVVALEAQQKKDNTRLYVLL